MFDQEVFYSKRSTVKSVGNRRLEFLREGENKVFIRALQEGEKNWLD